jgi:S-adenosylmethionine synthetase
MLIRDGLFSSESVSEGHPDKLADRVSDAILDAFLAVEPDARVACETLLADGLVVIAGEFKTRDRSLFDHVRGTAPEIAARVLRSSGYGPAWMGIDFDRLDFVVRFNHQSPHISMGVDRSDGVLGAGDQGLMFGYACDDTPELMPLPIHLAHRLVRKQAELRASGALPWLGPDAKSQISVRYRDGEPGQVEAVVLSTQHHEDIDIDAVRDAVRAEIIDPVIAADRRTDNVKILINPTGRFTVGGPHGDTGLTGRKIIVDTYGGAAPARRRRPFSGKDSPRRSTAPPPTCRALSSPSTSVRRALGAHRCTVQLAYAIGVAEPVSFLIETFGTGQRSTNEIVDALSTEFDLMPGGIIERLDLKRPIYELTTNYGHFGRALPEFGWERVHG